MRSAPCQLVRAFCAADHVPLPPASGAGMTGQQHRGLDCVLTVVKGRGIPSKVASALSMPIFFFLPRRRICRLDLHLHFPVIRLVNHALRQQRSIEILQHPLVICTFFCRFPYRHCASPLSYGVSCPAVFQKIHGVKRPSR